MQVFEVTVTAGNWTFSPHVAALTAEDAVKDAVAEIDERRGLQDGEMTATVDGVQYKVTRRVEYKVTRV